ncbi:MAG: hypothetical protein ACTJHT_11490 [Sphingobacterium sp.]|nr:hypothetical protein [Sphingobacterium sp. JB170]
MKNTCHSPLTPRWQFIINLLPAGLKHKPIYSCPVGPIKYTQLLEAAKYG